MAECGRATVLAAAVLAGAAGLPAAVSAQSEGYSPPRTSAGHPDLQGIWGNNSVTRTDEPMFEYACHEGNIGMEGILAGARVEELAAAGR